MKISKRTYACKVKSMSKEQNDTFKTFIRFTKKIGLTDSQFKALCTIVDKFNGITFEGCEYCRKNDIDSDDFFCDISNFKAKRG